VSVQRTISGEEKNPEVRSPQRDNSLSQLSHEIVIVLVRADPKPDNEIVALLRNSAIVIADSG